MVKNYVLDTNICLSDAQNLLRFSDNNVILTGVTLEEIDLKKNFAGEIGYQARECARILDDLRSHGDLRRGVRVNDSGGMLFVYYMSSSQARQWLPAGFDASKNDNRIIAACRKLNHEMAQNNSFLMTDAAYREDTDTAGVMEGAFPERTVLVTADRMMRVNAELAGVEVQSYKNEQVETTGYTGHIEASVESDILTEFYHDKSISASVLGDTSSDLLENEFVTLRNGSLRALSVHRNGLLYRVADQNMYNGFTPLNKMQTYALWALKQEDIPLVILLGPAGSAKTFLALAAGLDQVYEGQDRGDGRYGRILISRPNAQANDPGFGFLPGTLEEKMEPLLLPYMDNLEILLSGPGKTKESREQIQIQIDDLLSVGILEVCALSYIRGRSLTNTYLIMDEAQNATRSLIRDVITRAGNGAKIILAGDPEQCDNPQLDSRNNGLIFAKEAMKGSSLCAVVQFDSTNSVRSKLSREAVSRMKL